MHLRAVAQLMAAEGSGTDRNLVPPGTGKAAMARRDKSYM
jgi:hypothetical protein